MELQTSKNPLLQQGSTATLAEHQRALYLLLCEFDRACNALGIKYFLFAGTLLGAVRHEGFIPWDDDLDVLMLREDYDRFMREAPAVIDSGRFFLQREFSKHWPMNFSKLRLNGTTCLEKYHPKDPETHQGVYMDIFPCDNGAKTAAGRKMQFYCSKVVIAKALDRRGYETDSRAKKIFMALCRLLPMGPFLHITKRGASDSEYLHSFLGGASKFSKSVYPRAYFTGNTLACFEQGEYPIPPGYAGLLGILYGDYMTLPPEEERKCKEHAFLVDLEKSYEEYEHYRDSMSFDVFTRSIR